MNYPALISTAELARRLGGRGLRVVDCRHDLVDPELGARQYAKAHIPGAVFAHVEHVLSGEKTGSNGRHPLPEPGRFMDWLGAQGIGAGDEVVAYDASGGTMAARLWWMLRWLGHEPVSVLDGGFLEWLVEDRPTTAAVPEFEPVVYRGAARANACVDATEVRALLGRSGRLLLDARAAERFRGVAEPIDPVAGRIPESENRFCGLNLDAEGRFKSAEQLRREFDKLLAGRAPGDVVHYCGSGIAACHNMLAMAIAGFEGSRLYAGSWSEWIADPARPRAKD